MKYGIEPMSETLFENTYEVYYLFMVSIYELFHPILNVVSNIFITTKFSNGPIIRQDLCIIYTIQN